MRVTTVATAATLGAFAGLAGLHVAWGVGSSFPFDTRDELAVVGAREEFWGVVEAFVTDLSGR